MTIATPLSLRWERAQHIDRSAIESLGIGNPTPEKTVLPEAFSRGALGAYLMGYTAFGLQAIGWSHSG
jgi:hypothetical protein